MTRVSTVFGAITLALLASAVGAVGLGNIELRSALTEPLDAEINITNPGDLATDELSVGLASDADFRRAGVERPIFLQQIDFALRQDGSDLVVDITTNDNVQEPFLDFLVELRWPGGRLVREYTLLLDPPTFAPEGSAMVQTFPAEDPFDGAAPTAEAPSPDPVPQPTPVTPQTRVEQLADDQYRVANNDTLWEIALRARTDSAQTPQQIMLAIQDLNPDAFIDGNINRVRAGRLLNLPDAEQVAVRSAAQASQEVDRQNAAFRGVAPPGDTQISATDDTESAVAPGDAARDPDGFLEVITEPDAPDEVSAADGTTESETAQLQNELAIQRELNDELRLQYDEQQSRLTELEEQVELLSRLVDLQSESASQLQAATEALERQEAEAAGEVDSEPAEAGSEAAEAVDPTAAPEEDAGTSLPAEPEAPVEPETPAETETAPSLDQPASQPVSLLDQAVRWISQPYNGVLVLAVLVLILLLVNRMMKRRQTGDEDESLDVDDELLDDDDVEIESDDLLDGDELGTEERLPTADGPAGNAPAAGPAAAAEAIENAELYMAFQRYEEAERALKAAIEQSPGEPSLQLKLLELYSETGDAAAFEAIAGEFTGDAAAVDNLRQQLSSTPVRSGGNEQEFSGSFDGDDLTDNDFEDLDLDFDEAGDLSTGGRSEGVSGGKDTDLSADFDLGDDDGSDFELPELDDALPTMEETDHKASDNGLDFDRGAAGDTGPGTEEPVDSASWENSGDDFSVDFSPSSPEEPPVVDTPEPVLDSEDDDRSLDFDLADAEPEDRTQEATTPASEPFAEEEVSLSSDRDDDLDLDFDFGDLDTDASDSFTETTAAAGDDSDLDDPDDLGDLGSFEDLKDAVTDAEPAEPAVADPEPAPEPPEPAPEERQTASTTDEGPDGTVADDWDEDFDFLDGADEVATKIDLARAYIDMEDPDGARDILGEVMEEGTDEQKQQAQKLLAQL